MPAKATQPVGYLAGQAQVQVTGGGAVDRDTLEVCISGLLDNVEKHLDPRLTGEAWTTTYAWFRPGSPRLEARRWFLISNHRSRGTSARTRPTCACGTLMA